MNRHRYESSLFWMPSMVAETLRVTGVWTALSTVQRISADALELVSRGDAVVPNVAPAPLQGLPVRVNRGSALMPLPVDTENVAPDPPNDIVRVFAEYQRSPDVPAGLQNRAATSFRAPSAGGVADGICYHRKLARIQKDNDAPRVCGLAGSSCIGGEVLPGHRYVASEKCCAASARTSATRAAELL